MKCESPWGDTEVGVPRGWKEDARDKEGWGVEWAWRICPEQQQGALDRESSGSCLARMQMYAREIEKGRSMMALNVSFFLGIPGANVRG